ncbi:MAG: sigmaK-factor processing regulatory BofA [Erysipelotrichaceae bacterium]|nr:sigmaK-factor processing regulatory BofA [Erysipelotrichaceae bacterium]
MVIFMKIIKYVFKSILFGVLTLLIINLIGQFFNLKLPFSILSILLVGFFRLPGLIALLIFIII